MLHHAANATTSPSNEIWAKIKEKYGQKWLDYVNWLDLGKIKILHLPKRPISYGYGSDIMPNIPFQSEVWNKIMLNLKYYET